jgi:hypothetical protein
MHILQWLKSKTLTTPNSAEDVEQQEKSFTAVGNSKWYSHFGRHLDCVAITFLLKKVETCIQMFIVALLIIANSWKHPRHVLIG